MTPRPHVQQNPLEKMEPSVQRCSGNSSPLGSQLPLEGQGTSGGHGSGYREGARQGAEVTSPP